MNETVSLVVMSRDSVAAIDDPSPCSHDHHSSSHDRHQHPGVNDGGTTATMSIRRQLLECLDLPSAVALSGPSGRVAARWMTTRRLVEPCLRVRTRSSSQGLTGLTWHQGLQTKCLHTSPPPPPPPSQPAAKSPPSPLSTQTSYLPHLPRNFGVNQSLSISDSTRHTLDKIVAHFKAVRWAVAYGSGVVSQTGYGEDTKVGLQCAARATRVLTTSSFPEQTSHRFPPCYIPSLPFPFHKPGTKSFTLPTPR